MQKCTHKGIVKTVSAVKKKKEASILHPVP